MQMKQRFDLFFLTPQEQGYAKHYVKTNIRLCVVVILLITLFNLGMLVPNGIIFLGLSLFGGISYFAGDTMFLFFISICILAYLLPLYQFKFLMKRTSSDLYLSLPIARRRLFYVHYLIGLVFLVVLSLLEMMIVVMRDGLMLWVTLPLSLILIVLGCCLYTFFTCFIVRCHTVLDGIMICALYTILPVMIYYSLIIYGSKVIDKTLVANVGIIQFDSKADQYMSLIAALLSIPWQMNQWVQYFYQFKSSMLYSLSFLLLDLLVWIVIAIGCYRNGSRTFVGLHSEDSERPTKSLWTYPLLIPLMTFLFMLCFGDGKLFSILTFLTFVAYLIAYFFAQRKIAVDIRIIIRYILIVVLCALCYRIPIKTHIFGMVYEIPELETVRWVEINADIYGNNYNNYSSIRIENKQTINEIQNDHQTMLTHLSKNDEGLALSGTVTFNYSLKDGSDVFRTYYIYTEEETYYQTLLKKWVMNGYVTNGDQKDTNVTEKEVLE